MISRADLEKAACGFLETSGVGIKNPITQEHELLRPTLLPSLLSVVQFNFNHGQKDLKIFEIGKRYFSSGEKETLGIVMTGVRVDDWRGTSKEPIDFYDVK